jgi:hypothetical protein
MNSSLNYLPSAYGSYDEVKANSLQSFKEISHLNYNWDGEEGLAPHARILENAKYIFKELLEITFPPDITPNNNGTISCEWETSMGSAHLELGMTRYSMYLRSVDEDTQYFNGEIRNINKEIPLIAESLNKKIYRTNDKDNTHD